MTKLELEAAQDLYDRGRWRGALMALDAADAAKSSIPGAVALWIKCKGDLDEQAGLKPVYLRLLTMPEATVNDVGGAFGGLGAANQQALGPHVLAWLDARDASAADREQVLCHMPATSWPADHLFQQLHATDDTHTYDRLLEVARRSFPDDPRHAQVKPRPLDPVEQQRIQAEAARRRAEQAKAARTAARAAARHELRGRFLREPTLEAAILGNPDDVAAHEVYGDWLEQHGDPRGQLVNLQAQRSRRPDDPALAAAERELLDRLEPALLDTVPELVLCRPTFRLGFLRSIRLACGHASDFAGALALLLSLDERRFLQELVIGAVSLDGEMGGVMDFGATIARLAQRASDLPSLRSLFIGDFTSEECQLSWSQLGDASPLYEALPELRSLKLRAGGMTLGDIVLPQLERFTIETGGLARDSFEAVMRAKWPRLRSLSLWFGQEDYGGECTASDVEQLLSRSDLKLRHLGLANAAFVDELCPLLLDSPLLSGLESLDLSLGCLTRAGALVLAENKERLAHLKHLDLSKNCLEEEELSLVEGICAHVDLRGQDPDRVDDEGTRYAAVGE